MSFCAVTVGKYFNRGLFLCQFSRCFPSSFATQILQVSDEDENENTRLNYAELNSLVKRDASRGRIVNAVERLNVLRMFPGRPTVHEYNQLIICYLESQNVDSGVLMEIYNVMKVSGPYPNWLTFEILINGMVSFGSSRESIFMAEDMCRSGYRPHFRSLSRLLEKSLDLDILVDSLYVLDLMLKFDYYPMPLDANRFIVSLCGSGMFREAHFLFSILLEKSRAYFQGACSYSHNQIVWALCKSGQLINALAFFCALGKKGIVCNESSYTALVYGFCRERLWKEAYHCLDVMTIVGCRPNVKTYTVIVKFLCDVGKINEALGILLDKMNEARCDPDLVTFNIVLRELCHQDMLGEMYALLEHMDQKGFSPNQFTYASLAGGLLRRGYITHAKKLLLVSMSPDGVADTTIYNIYLRTLCCERKSEEALCHLKSLITEGFTPNSISYNTILKGICEEKSISDCLGFFKDIRWEGNKPDLISYNTILSAAARKEKGTMIITRLLDQMQYDGVKLDITRATSLLLYYYNARKYSECLKLFEFMMNDGRSSTILTSDTLIERLCNIRALNMAYWIFNILKSFGYSLDSTTYITLIHAYRDERNHLAVSQFFIDMLKQKIKPDAATCESFFAGFDGEDKILVTLQVQDQMREVGVTPNIYIWNAILEALLEGGKLWEIVWLLKEITDQCEANRIYLGILNEAMPEGWTKGFPRAVKHLETVFIKKFQMDI